MSRAGVDYDTVKHTAFKLLSQGTAPSVQKIRDTLGTGSNTTIAEHLKIWRDDYANKAIHQLPATLPKELIASMEVLWQTAMEHAETQLAAYKKSLENERDVILKAQCDAEKNAAELTQRLSVQQLTYEQLMETKQNLTTELSIATDRLEKKDELIAIEKNQYEARLQRVYQEKDATLASLQEIKNDNNALREKLSQQADENQQRLAKERTQQEQSENRWLTLIDQSKQEAKELHKKIESTHQAHEKVVTQLGDQLAEMRQSVYENKALLKVMTEEAHQLKEENKMLSAELADAKSLILKLESEKRLEIQQRSDVEELKLARSIAV